MTADSTVNAYLRTQVLTASPEQLRLMLLEGAVRFLRQAREGLAAKDFSVSFDGFSKSRNIVIELMNSMRPDVDPALCSRVHSLYVFIYQTIVEASFEKSIEKADKAITMLDYERETWELAIRKLAEERGHLAHTDVSETSSPSPAVPLPRMPSPAMVGAPATAGRTLSIQG